MRKAEVTVISAGEGVYSLSFRFPPVEPDEYRAISLWSSPVSTSVDMSGIPADELTRLLEQALVALAEAAGTVVVQS